MHAYKWKHQSYQWDNNFVKKRKRKTYWNVAFKDCTYLRKKELYKNDDLIWYKDDQLKLSDYLTETDIKLYKISYVIPYHGFEK